MNIYVFCRELHGIILPGEMQCRKYPSTVYKSYPSRHVSGSIIWGPGELLQMLLLQLAWIIVYKSLPSLLLCLGTIISRRHLLCPSCLAPAAPRGIIHGDAPVKPLPSCWARTRGFNYATDFFPRALSSFQVGNDSLGFNHPVCVLKCTGAFASAVFLYPRD